MIVADVHGYARIDQEPNAVSPGLDLERLVGPPGFEPGTNGL